jgi:hypothetical protein
VTVNVDGCSVCGAPARARGFCQTHYHRWYIHGDPLTTKRILGNDRARFESKVDRTGGLAACHPWLGARQTGGWGYFWLGDRMRSAHTVAWQFAHGPVPAGQELDHECHNRAMNAGACFPGVCPHRLCCNDLHLAPKTRQQHMADTHPWPHARGEQHGLAKLTWAQIPEIHALLRDGELSLSAIGRQFGVGHGAISAIRDGRTWRLDLGPLITDQPPLGAAPCTPAPG